LIADYFGAQKSGFCQKPDFFGFVSASLTLT